MVRIAGDGMYVASETLISVHDAASSLVLKSPSAVAAYSVAGVAESNARALTAKLEPPKVPGLAATQLWPPSAPLKPPASVPANTVEDRVGSTAIVDTFKLVRPALAATQVM